MAKRPKVTHKFYRVLRSGILPSYEEADEMRWTRGESRENLEDRRGQTMRGGGGMRLGLGGMLILLVLSFIFKVDLVSLVGGGGLASSPAEMAEGPIRETAAEAEAVEMLNSVNNSTARVWTKLFARAGREYQPAKLVLFRNVTRTAFGYGEAATGPFYCPGDLNVYLDLAFLDELRTRFGAPGEFAQAYVVAHEIGHHVQRLLGTEAKVRQAQRARPNLANQYSVALELQADCYAGIWGKLGTDASGRPVLESQSDIESGLRAAAAIGDDRIQKMSGRAVSPESWTHGSSEQRMTWLRKGLETGAIEACNTFQ
jgi:predicted metalloprotease